MTPVIGIVIFLVLFAVLMVAVGLGSRFLELRGKKQMETMLNPATGQVQLRWTGADFDFARRCNTRRDSASSR